MKHIITLIIAAFGVIFSLWAQNTAENQPANQTHSLFERLQTVDSLSGGSVQFFQDRRIERLFLNKISGGTVKAAGYRVQVFSSNAQRTAKDEAFGIEQELKKLFPQYAVYVNYSAPFWKVRIGDFDTYNAAQAFRDELVKNFANYKAETYVVKDQINK